MWEKIQIQINCVETQTNKAVLINFPKNSKYKGYSFYAENPSLSIWESIKKILHGCGLL